MFKGIEHVAIISKDPKKLAHWYQDVLEFKLVRQSRGKYFVQATNGSLIEFMPGADGSEAADHSRYGLSHIAIDVEDFFEACEILENRGVIFESDKRTGGSSRMVFFRDPEHNLLHLIERLEPVSIDTDSP